MIPSQPSGSDWFNTSSVGSLPENESRPHKCTTPRHSAGAVGQTVPVLLERRGRHAGQLVGRSPYMQAVHVEAPESLFGSIAAVRVEAAHANSLAGVLALPDPAAAVEGAGA